jgi:tetrapyrrole methylase family protein / MazG family protein
LILSGAFYPVLKARVWGRRSIKLLDDSEASMKERKKTARSSHTRQKKRTSVLEGISGGVSSLSLAYRLTEKASNVGFDWPDVEGILKKLDEEMQEFREALSLQKRQRIREEIGDLLFVIVNIARFLEIDPEVALRRTIEKFISRFHYIERSLRKKGKTFRESNLLEMDRLWGEAKKKQFRG